MPQNLYIANRDQPEWPWHIRPEVLEAVHNLKLARSNFSLIDLGSSYNPFNRQYLTHTFDIMDAPFEGVTHFKGNLNRFQDWKQILDYVEIHGKFSFANCTHTLEDLANPMLTLEMLPHIAEQGFIAVPSKYNELQRREGPFRGAVHHRWIFNNRDNILVAYPKISILDTMLFYPYEIEVEKYAETELRMFWINTIDFTVANNDYLGPTLEAVIDIYKQLLP